MASSMYSDVDDEDMEDFNHQKQQEGEVDVKDLRTDNEADMRRERERKEQELKKSPKVEFVTGGTQPGQIVPLSKFSMPIPCTDDKKDDVLVNKVRPGLKREFAFAFKALSEIAGSLGRTRTCRSVSVSPLNSNEKRLKGKNGKKSEDLIDLGSKNLEGDLGDGLKNELKIECKSELEDTKSEKNGGNDDSNGNVDDSRSQNDGNGNGPLEDLSSRMSGRDIVIHSCNCEKNDGNDDSDGKVEDLKSGEDKDDTASISQVKDLKRKKKNGGNDKSNCKPLRRFTRSLLKLNVEAVNDGENVKAKSIDERSMCREEIEKKNKPKEVLGNDGHDACGEISGWSVLNFIDVENLKNERSEGSEKCDIEVKVDVKLNNSVNEEGANGGGDRENSGKVEDGKYTRRFTRSLLKPKMEMVQESSLIVEEKDLKIIKNEFVESKCNIDEKGGMNDSKANEKSVGGDSTPMRRFTRLLLKPKVESVEGLPTSGADSVIGSPAACSSSSVSRMRKENALKKFPMNLKELFDSGVLEGQEVKYMRGSKARGAGEAVLRGVVRGPGILCFCNTCKGNEVVLPTVFELHARSTNKHPPEYILLENGTSLRAVMNACKNASLETLDAVLQLAVGSLKKSSFCLKCRGSLADSDNGKSMLVCSQCMELKESQASVSEITDTDKGTSERDSVSKPPRSVITSSTSRSKSKGRITTKDLRMHKLVFEEDVLPDGTEVAYYSQGQKLLVGYKKGFGIFCSCCNTEVSPSQFEAHAGWASRRKPYLHIYTSNGVSLHELSISLSKNRKYATYENDDLCQICRDGGNLLCCDVCPRSYHKECIPLAEIPKGKWYCNFCLHNLEKEKFVEHNVNAIAAGRVAGVDSIDQINRRCIRIVKTMDSDFGGCVFCRGHDFANEFGPRTVLLCDQCEKEFHVGCLKENNMADYKVLPKGKWYCCSDCKTIATSLQKFVVRGEESLLESFIDVIKKKVQEKSAETSSSIISWRLLNHKLDSSDDAKKLLADALAILHEQFAPIIVSENKADRDLITSMLFGKTYKQQELTGMYCATLMVNNVVVSCAVIRIFGQELAELPLVATSSQAQGKGYFQALFSCLEKLLAFLKVKNFVLPAAEEAESIWTNKFGFNKLTHEEFLKFRKSYDKLMVFQGTSMLHKSVPKCRIVGRSEGG